LGIIADRLRRGSRSLEIGWEHLSRRVVRERQGRGRLKMGLIRPIEIPRARLRKALFLMFPGTKAQTDPAVTVEPLVSTRMAVS
jgi:hypothetical protein